MPTKTVTSVVNNLQRPGLGLLPLHLVYDYICAVHSVPVYLTLVRHLAYDAPCPSLIIIPSDYLANSCPALGAQGTHPQGELLDLDLEYAKQGCRQPLPGTATQILE